MQCAGRTQGHGCTAPTFYAAHVEAQLGSALAEFVLQPDDREHLVRDWVARQGQVAPRGDERSRTLRKIERLREAYLQDELGRTEYQERKAALTQELAALPEDAPRSDDGTGRRLADYLADVAGAWAAATPAERNALARALFASVLIENKTPVAVLPRPDLLPFIAALAQKSSDADLGGSRVGVSAGVSSRCRIDVWAEATGVARAVASRPRLGGGRRGAGVPHHWDLGTGDRAG